MKSTWKLPIIFLAIIITSGLLGLVLPGLVRCCFKCTYSKHDIVAKIVHPQKKGKRIKEEYNRNEMLKSLATRITGEYGKGEDADARRISKLTRKREELIELNSSIHIPYEIKEHQYLNFSTAFWCFSYSVLLTLFYIVTPLHDRSDMPTKCSESQVLVWKVIIFVHFLLLVVVIWQLPGWARNFCTQQEESRIVFAHSNYDISPLSFWVEQSNIFIFSVFLACLWLKWFHLAIKSHRRETESNPSGGENREGPCRSVEMVFNEMRRKVSDAFHLWQLESVLISCIFVWGTFFYWDKVINVGDTRYYIEAIGFHALWAITWGIISIQFVQTWREWDNKRHKAIWKCANGEINLKAKREDVIKYLQALKPVSSISLLFSSVVAVGAFVAPLFELLFK